MVTVEHVQTNGSSRSGISTVGLTGLQENILKKGYTNIRYCKKLSKLHWLPSSGSVGENPGVVGE